MKSVLKANKENLTYLIRHFWPLIIVELLFAITSGVSGAISSYMSKTFVNSIINDKSLKVAMKVVVAVAIFVLFKNIIQSIAKVYSNYVFSKIRVFSKSVFLGYTKQLNLSFLIFQKIKIACHEQTNILMLVLNNSFHMFFQYLPI